MFLKSEFLQKLSLASGPSGYEGDVRKLIIDYVKPYVDEVKVDNIGNVIVHKKGNGKRVLVDAHMDEVGLIITGFNNDGTLRFAALGGINSKVIPCKVVDIGDKKIKGVIGLKPIHLQSAQERKANITLDKCCIDIGSNSEEETRKIVELGDYAVFETEFSQFGENLVKGKALDDRIGCAVLAEALKEKYSCDLYGSFNVQEEVGERGALVAAYGVNPDIGIALEGTICADMPNVPEDENATVVGNGPAISIMDRTSIFNTDISDSIMDVAKSFKIPYQKRRAIAGGNDAGAMVLSGDGAKVATISVPCRYIHSSVSVASIDDFENAQKLLINYLKTM